MNQDERVASFMRSAKITRSHFFSSNLKLPIFKKMTSRLDAGVFFQICLILTKDVNRKSKIIVQFNFFNQELSTKCEKNSYLIYRTSGGRSTLNQKIKK